MIRRFQVGESLPCDDTLRTLFSDGLKVMVGLLRVFDVILTNKRCAWALSL